MEADVEGEIHADQRRDEALVGDDGRPDDAKPDDAGSGSCASMVSRDGKAVEEAASAAVGVTPVPSACRAEEPFPFADRADGPASCALIVAPRSPSS